MSTWFSVFLLTTIFALSKSQHAFHREIEYKCPDHWIRFQDSCYRFFESPAKPREKGRKICQATESHLLTINSLEEHKFILNQLQNHDHQHRKWYIGVISVGDSWTNITENFQMVNMKNGFLPEITDVVYSYSESLKRWGLEKVTGDDDHLYICEAPIYDLHNLIKDERTYDYGIEIDDPLKIPRGPYFKKQPVNTVFDTMRGNKDVSLSCLAGGYPTPTYEWFMEYYYNDKFFKIKVDPLINRRYTISGGSLIIHNPMKDVDSGSYYCKATNKFGTIRSKSAELSFRYIREFSLEHEAERGDQHWGKAVYCDPPEFFPNVMFDWVRESIPNMVEEDNRIFVSYDGSLYFSSLDLKDQGNYFCCIRNAVGEGRCGPPFSLSVDQQSSSQDLKFANNFPKAFPKVPKIGDKVRLECLAFGYPVSSYSWSRIDNAPLPPAAKLINYNRVLIIPKIQVQDQGIYECHAYNGRVSLKKSVNVTIQAEPNFTIELVDKHIDKNGALVWTCEAFGIPDVVYTWFKNGEPIYEWDLPVEDVERYTIRDNVLKIKQLDSERDSAMYQCSAKNQLTTKYTSAQLRVIALKPSFKKRPLKPETYAVEDGNVTIVCNPEAAPKPKFTWKKDGFLIGGEYRRIIMENGNLVINPVAPDDEGTYVCTASNLYGSDESRGRIRVSLKPRYIKIPTTRIKIAVNNNQTLRCRTEDNENLDTDYVWKHNGLQLYNIMTNPHVLFHKGDLNIVNVTFEEAGNWECTAVNSKFVRSIKIELIVEGPPGPPEDVQIVDIQNRSATIQWTDGVFNGRPIIAYEITARTNWNNDTWFTIISGFDAAEVKNSTGRKEAYLENLLNPYTAYEFRVSAYNELGYGKPSNPSPSRSTSSDKPAKAPFNVGGGGGKVGDLTITWDTLKPSEQFGPGIYYKVYWRRKGETEFQSKTLKEYGNVNKYVAQVNKIYYYTEYEVKVQAANDLGFGPESEVVTIYSAKDMPKDEVVTPQEEPVVTLEEKVVVTPEEEEVVTPQEKVVVTPQEEEVVTPQEKIVVTPEEVVTPQEKIVVTPEEVVTPQEKIVVTPEEEVVAIQKLMVHSYNETALNVSWIPVGEIHERIKDKLIGYKIKYWRKKNVEESANYYLSRNTRPWSLIVGLQPDTYYFVKVMAYNNAGDGPVSERYLAKTYRKAPQKAPSSVATYAINSSAINVVWQYVQSSQEEEPLLGYKIKTWEVDQNMSQANEIIVPIVGGKNTKLKANVSNLRPGEAYYLRVLAFSKGGNGRMSSPVHSFQMIYTAQLTGNGAGQVVFDTILSLCAIFILGAFQPI